MSRPLTLAGMAATWRELQTLTGKRWATRIDCTMHDFSRLAMYMTSARKGGDHAGGPDGPGRGAGPRGGQSLVVSDSLLAPFDAADRIAGIPIYVNPVLPVGIGVIRYNDGTFDLIKFGGDAVAIEDL